MATPPTMKHFAFTLACMLIFLNTPAQASAPAEIPLTSNTAKKPVAFPHAQHQSRNKCDAYLKDNFPTDKNWDMKKSMPSA